MKSKTHICMANMIISEIRETSAVTIDGSGKYIVPSDIVSAITRYPKAFRAGAIGPDFFPDMFVGHAEIHRINSGKWLDIMEAELLKMSRKDKGWEEAYSFYIGFYIHYCGDMYGQDYVNALAKGSLPDVTSAARDEESAKILTRHLLIEAYMDERVPDTEELAFAAPVDFILRCFTGKEAAGLYHNSDINVLKYLIDLKEKMHNFADCGKGFSRSLLVYEKDIDDAIYKWLKLSNRVAEYLIYENDVYRAREDIFKCLESINVKLDELSDLIMRYIEHSTELTDFLDYFRTVEKAFKEAMKKTLQVCVYAVTGVKKYDINMLVSQVDGYLKNPRMFLNNGILYAEKNITDTIDKDLDYHGRAFLTYSRCLNMCRMVVMGVNNLNVLIEKYYSRTPVFEEKTARSSDKREAVCDFTIAVDAKVMDHLFSLDGICPEGKPDYKPWNEPSFFLNLSPQLRRNVLLPVFNLENEELDLG